MFIDWNGDGFVDPFEMALTMAILDEDDRRARQREEEEEEAWRDQRRDKR